MVAPQHTFKGRTTLAAVFSQEGFRGMLVLVILLPNIYDLRATNLISPWRDAITVLDASIVRGRPRRSRRL
jgi:hypothetical protein